MPSLFPTKDQLPKRSSWMKEGAKPSRLVHSPLFSRLVSAPNTRSPKTPGRGTSRSTVAGIPQIQQVYTLEVVAHHCFNSLNPEPPSCFTKGFTLQNQINHFKIGRLDFRSRVYLIYIIYVTCIHYRPGSSNDTQNVCRTWLVFWMKRQ